MNEIAFLEKIKSYFVETPPHLKTAHTVQILMLRQTHDFTIFRTEETRELNIATLPKSIEDHTPIHRVAMLASKQKAPENRAFITQIRTAASEVGLTLKPEQKNCTLKDNLCRQCPRCVLFGAVTTEKGRGQARWNIKHRIEYSTAYSIEPYEEISELLTFNAVSSITQSTGQALGYTENIQPIVTFPSIVTLNSVTPYEFIIYLKTLMACKSYGAETRVKGDMTNIITGIVGGYEELITPLEYVLELSAEDDYKQDPMKATQHILDKYKNYASFRNRLTIVSAEETNKIIEEIRKYSIAKDFVQHIYEDSEKFMKSVDKAAASELASGE
jgi:CRISPR type I-D-associated protein Csc2